METTNKRTLKDDPSYFGAYLNMARHNMFLIVNHVAEKFPELKYKNLKDDEEIIEKGKNILLNVFDSNNIVMMDYRDGVFHYLKKFLPLVKVFNPEEVPKPKKKVETKAIEQEQNGNVKFEELHRFLLKGFLELDGLRNSYTHSFACDDYGNETPKKITIDNSIVNNKSIIDSMNDIFKYAPLYSFYNFQSTQEGIKDTHHTDDFEHLKKYELFVDSNKFTEEGFYFFVCLFLEKKYAFKFLKRLKGYKNETTASFVATLKTFTAYSLKLPHEKLLSDNPKQSLLLDMLNELNKCPKELFNHLTSSDKKEFEPKLEDIAKQNIIVNSRLNDEDSEDIIKEIISMKRHEDRFPYFALRFLDETETFKDIRFQIRLGKMLMNQYPKEILKVITNRKIIKEINAFGRLKEFTDEGNIFKSIKNNKETEIEFEQYAPHYNISNNKIGFLLNGNAQIPKLEKNTKGELNIELTKPTAFLSIHELPKIILLELLFKGEVRKLIISYIKTLENSIYNETKLESLREGIVYDPAAFSRRIESNRKELRGAELKNETDKRKEYSFFLKERRELLDTALNAKSINIKANQLPAKINDYLMYIDDTSLNKIIHNKVAELKSEIKLRLKHIGNGKIPKIGEMATFIAKDMIAMISTEEIKQKITSVIYNKLQNKLAYFGLHKADVIELCDQFGIFDNKTGNVFVTKHLIDRNSSILEMYQSYLEAKKSWILKTLEKKEDRKTVFFIPDNKPIPLIFHKYHNRISFASNIDGEFTNWLKNKTIVPIDLPTNLFDDRIALLLKSKLAEMGGQINENDRFSILLNKYLKNDTQPFYNFERAYSFKKEGFVKKRGNISRFNNYTTKEKIKVEREERVFSVRGKTSKDLKKTGGNVEANEKLIRFTQTKDRLLKLMCEELVKQDKSLQLDRTIDLKNIFPNSEYSPLDNPVVFKQKIHNKTLVAQDSERWKNEIMLWQDLSKEEKEKNPAAKKWYAWTVKDFGTFKKLLSDKRLANLFDYFESNEIPISIIERELMEYDKYRELIFDEIFRIENAIINKDKAGLLEIAKDKKNQEVQFIYYIKWLNSKQIRYNESFLQGGRNRFSHSQFPEREITGLLKITELKQEDYNYYCEVREYKDKYDSLSKQIYNNYREEVSDILAQIEFTV